MLFSLWRKGSHCQQTSKNPGELSHFMVKLQSPQTLPSEPKNTRKQKILEAKLTEIERNATNVALIEISEE